MRKIIFNLIFIFSIFVVSGLFITDSASAQMGMMGGYWSGGDSAAIAQSPELNTALQDIYQSQNITNQAQTDCSKVTDDQFVQLGDAYMGVMLPNTQQHEAMDNMMGGEGSDSLRQAHINMGRSYLGCWSNYNSGPIYMPMMGGLGFVGNTPTTGDTAISGSVSGSNGLEAAYPANNNMYSATRTYSPFAGGFMGAPMMGGFSGLGMISWITVLLVWTLLILGVIAIVKWLNHKAE